MSQEINTKLQRKTVGSGRWFESNGTRLKKEVEGYINSAYEKVPEIDEKVIAGLCPHAGFRYSGPTAGYTLAAMKKNAMKHGTPDVCFIIGFSHSKRFEYAAVMDGASITSPIETSIIDHESIELFMKGREKIVCDYRPHNGEHSAENELPFVQCAFPGMKVVIVLVGTHNQNVWKQVSDGLKFVSEKKNICVVASTDMLHDESHELVEKVDRKTMDLTVKMDIDGLNKNWSYENQIYCGISAVIPTMQFCKELGCKKAIELDLTNSEKITGRYNSGWVVGYGACVFVI